MCRGVKSPETFCNGNGGKISFLEVIESLLDTIVENVKISCSQAFGCRGHKLKKVSEVCPGHSVFRNPGEVACIFLVNGLPHLCFNNYLTGLGVEFRDLQR